MSDDLPKPPRSGLSSEPTPAALRVRITAGILYATARFTPVPLLDDVLREQITGWMVRATVPGSFPKSGIKPLWASEDGCLGGCLSAALWLPLKILLFPIRKVIAIALSVRWVTRDLAEMLLLGRVLDHALEVGLLQDGRDPAELAQQSREIRKAFDVALESTDTGFLTALLATALGPLRGIVAASLRTLQRFRRTDAEAPTLEGGDKEVIEASVGRVETMLAQPEVRRFLAEFDARILENLEVLAKRRAALPPGPQS